MAVSGVAEGWKPRGVCQRERFGWSYAVNGRVYLIRGRAPRGTYAYTVQCFWDAGKLVSDYFDLSLPGPRREFAEKVAVMAGEESYVAEVYLELAEARYAIQEREIEEWIDGAEESGAGKSEKDRHGKR